MKSKADRFIGWLIFCALTIGALHAILFFSLEELHRLWLFWIRHPRLPLANPGIFLGIQVLALIWIVVGCGADLRAIKREMYYVAFWTSFNGFWFFFRMENLLVLFGVSTVLMVLTFIDLKRDSSAARND